MAFQFKFPDVGEGIHEGEIVRWRVKVGDAVREDQVLIEMETAKAVVELPAPKNGTVIALVGKEGDTVHVGDVLVVIGEKGETWSPGGTGAEQESAAVSKSGPGVIGQIPTEEVGVVLPPRRAEGRPATAPKTPTVAPQKPRSKTSPRNFEAWGKTERVPVKGVRKSVAEHMVESVSTIPHVTHVDEFDATNLIKLREGKKAEAEQKGVKLTYLPFIMKALAECLKKHPGLNAAFDDAKQEIVFMKYYNVGIAVDTPEGLMVPVLKNVDQKDIFQLAKEIAELAEKCRARKIELEGLQGGSFSITNVGSVGGQFATPIILPGQSAILAVMRMKEKPVAIEGKVEIRPMLTLALAFDHRVLDGADAARFLNDLMLALSK